MLTGIHTALITPFKKGETLRPEIDFQSLEALLQRQLESGVDGLVLCGTTAEASSLTEDEKLELLRFVVSFTKGEVPICFGTGSNSTWKTLELIEKVKDQGVSSVLVVTPFYNKPSEAGLVSHFETIANKSSLPVVLYDICGRTCTDLSPELIARLSKHQNIVAIKCAPINGSKLAAISCLASESFHLLAGDDSLLYLTLCSGGVGAISAAANVMGKELISVVEAFRQGKTALARSQQDELKERLSALFMEANPGPVKHVLYKQGVISSAGLRLPLVEVSEGSRRVLDNLF